MELSERDYYRALKAHDRRFDGRFFVCVASTGIYCRPVCSAVTPQRRNCTFVRTAAEAEAAGYRACLRCRPETAPGSPAWNGTATTVNRALRLISETATEGKSLDELARRLGVGTRHLRRLFKQHLGATPKAVAQTERFAIARQLLVETDLPIADVAMASGFGSIRRFNDATRSAFGVTPRQFRHQRRAKSTVAKTTGLRLVLGYRPPFAWSAMLSYLGGRSISGVEEVIGERYRRTIHLDQAVGTMTVDHEAKRNRLVVELDLDQPVALGAAVRRVRDLFDLDASPTEVAEHLRTDPFLAAQVRITPGLRIPGCWDPFELAVRAVVGQQISVKGATTVLKHIVESHGRRIGDDTERADGGLRLVFPTPADLVAADWSGIGLTAARKRTLQSLARTVHNDPELLHPAAAREQTRSRLLEIPGIGPWTAEYIALRGLRDCDAFPASDLGLLKASGMNSAKKLASHANDWRPWRGYAALYLWSSQIHQHSENRRR